MPTKTLLRFCFLLLATATFASAQATVPDTPAGHTLQAWLTAFNSGDRAQLDNYVKTIDHNQSADGLLAFRTQTGASIWSPPRASTPSTFAFRSRRNIATLTPWV